MIQQNNFFKLKEIFKRIDVGTSRFSVGRLTDINLVLARTSLLLGVGLLPVLFDPMGTCCIPTVLHHKPGRSAGTSTALKDD